MNIPGWQLARLAAEAANDLVGCVVDAIRAEEGSGRLLFMLSARRGKRLVIIEVRGQRPVCFWVTEKRALAGLGNFSPTERFNRLRGARLTDLDLPQPDRILRLRFRRPQSANPVELTLWMGWTGRTRALWL